MRAKERIVYAGLALFSLWPAVHIGLALGYGLSPWKAAGWGMYTTPRFGELGMEVYGRAEGQAELDKLTAPSPELRAEAAIFLERRRWLGRLARPDRMAEAVLLDYPNWREVRLVVFRPELEPSTGMVVWRSVTEDYVRPGNGG